MPNWAKGVTVPQADREELERRRRSLTAPGLDRTQPMLSRLRACDGRNAITEGAVGAPLAQFRPDSHPAKALRSGVLPTGQGHSSTSVRERNCCADTSG